MRIAKNDVMRPYWQRNIEAEMVAREKNEAIFNPNISHEERNKLRKEIDEWYNGFGVGLQPPQEMLDTVEVDDVIVTNGSYEKKNPMLIIGPKGYKESKEKLPVIFNIHGGGLCMMHYKFEYKSYISATNRDNCINVSVEYPLTPEHQYKEVISATEAAVDYIIEHADEYNMDLSRVVGRGMSSGGHLVAATAHKLRLRNKLNNDPDGFQFCALQLIAPQLDDKMGYNSSDVDSSNWGPDIERQACRAFLGEDYGAADVPEWAYPLRAKDYSGLPATYLHAGELEHDRDSIIKYANKLMEAGIFCELIVWGGASHDVATRVTDPIGKVRKELFQAQITEALEGKLVRKVPNSITPL